MPSRVYEGYGPARKGLGTRQEKSYRAIALNVRARLLTGETPHGLQLPPHALHPSRVTPLTGLMGNNFLPSLLATLDGRAYVKADLLGFELRVRLGEGCEGGAAGELCTVD